MNDFLNNIRSKPDHHKKKISFFISATVCMVILLGWLSTYNINIYSEPIADNTNIAETDSRDNSKNQITIDAPASSLKASLIGVWQDLKALFTSSNVTEYSKNSVDIEAGSR